MSSDHDEPLDSETDADDAAIDRVMEDAGEIYGLISQNMLNEVNQSVESRMCAVLFMMGAIYGAGVRHGLSPRLIVGCFAAAMRLMDLEEREAYTVAKFGVEVWGEPEGEWHLYFGVGTSAYVDWTDGSEVKVLEWFAQAVEAGPELTPQTAPRNSLADQVARIFR